MRAWLAVAASGFGSVGAVVASLDAHADFVPFYVGLAFGAAVAAAAAHEPFVETRRRVARLIAGVWVLAATWVGALFLMASTVWQASSPPPTPEQVFLGIPASAWYVVALYGGTVLMVLVAFLPRTRTDVPPMRSTAHDAPGDRAARDPA